MIRYRQSAILTIRQSTVLSRFRQIIIDHPAPIFLRFRHRRVAAFFVAADLVFRVQTFEHKLAGGDESAPVSDFD